MRILAAVAVVLSLSIFTPAHAEAPIEPGQAPPPWSEFAVPESGFAVSLPSTPRARAAVGENATSFTRAYDAVYDGMAFSVSYEFWPGDEIQKKLPPNELLTLSRDRILRTTSNLRNEKRFPVDDGAAVDFTVDSPAKTQTGPYSLRVRFIARTDAAENVHAYVLVATFKSSQERDPDIERFLTSFRVLHQKS